MTHTVTHTITSTPSQWRLSQSARMTLCACHQSCLSNWATLVLLLFAKGSLAAFSWWTRLLSEVQHALIWCKGGRGDFQVVTAPPPPPPLPLPLPIVADVSSSVYWRHPFKTICSPQQLTEYFVLQTEPVVATSKGSSGARGDVKERLLLMDLWVAKSKDIGIADQQTHVRTHLGHLLNPGDSAMG